MIKIFHNPRCRKSREALNLLEQQGEKPTIIEYLKTPLSVDELQDIIHMLDIKPEQLIRKGESDYKDRFKGKQLSDQEWLEAMGQFPKLMERPIVIKDGKAAIGRPPENILEIL